MGKNTETKKEKTFLEYNLDILKDNKELFLKLFAGAVILYSFLYGMWRIPFIDLGVFRTSGITLADSLFVLAISALVSFFIVLWKEERKQRIHSNTVVGATGTGIAAIVAGICPVCQSIAIVALGSTFLNIPTSALAPYLTIIKIASLGIVILAVYLKADSIYTKKCKMCLVPQKEEKKEDDLFNRKTIALIVGIALILFFNQWQVSSIDLVSESKITISDISQIKSTGQAIQALFPVGEIKSDQDAIDMMISQGTPEYGEAMGITFDDPTGALALLADNYPHIKKDLQDNYPEVWTRYLSLATKPVGISCEFCCGVGPNGITKTGDLTCGCSHNPAIQSLTMLLMKDTDMTDAEVLKEAMRWKSVWFPRDMVGLALKASGGEIQVELPGMVGGC